MEQPTENTYTLTAGEKAAMTALNFNVVSFKAQLRDLADELRHAEKRFEGALQLLGGAHDMPAVRIAPDLSSISPA